MNRLITLGSGSVCRENDGCCCCCCLWVGSLFLIHEPSPASFSRMWQRTQPCGMTRVQHLHAQPFQPITWDRRLKQLGRAYLHACHPHSPSLPLSENSSWEMKTSRFLRGQRTHLTWRRSGMSRMLWVAARSSFPAQYQAAAPGR